MAPGEAETEQLLNRLGRGEAEALGPLLDHHRPRLRAMVALRLDGRLKARIDPSDVVQEALAEAAGKLPDYVVRRPIPFYPWLRQIAWEHVIRLHRRHVRAGRRSVVREEWSPPLPDASVVQLADRFAGNGTSPSGRICRAERRARVTAALAQLADHDRDVLVLRFLEHLSTREIAAVLGLAESGVKTRQLRALRRLRDLLGDEWAESVT